MALLKQKSTLKKAGNVRGGCWAAVIDTIQDKKLKEQLIQATIHANKPHYPVITLMQELNSLGNSNRVLSNMGEPVIQAQKAHIHSLISAITTVDTLETAEIAEDIATTIQAPVTVTLEDEQLKSLKFLENFLTQPTNVATGQNGDWTAKPSPKIYQRFLKENSSQTNPNQLKIFIDDKKKNVLAAIESGFDIGIIFTTPEALREILFMLGQTEITYKNTTIKSNNLLPRS